MSVAIEPTIAQPVVVRAARFHTVDDTTAPEATAVLIGGGRFLAVGTERSCHDRADALGLRPETVDLGDATVVPGFVDPHAHPLMFGQMRAWVDCGPDRASSIPEIVALLRAAADRLPPGRAVRGYGYEQQNLVERRHPTRFELDAVAGDREVYLMNASGHGGVVNSLTFARAGVDRSTPNPPGGEFFRDEDGELTGELSDAACNVLTGIGGVKVGQHGPNFHLADPLNEHVRQLVDAQSAFIAGGVTTVGDCQVTSRELRTYQRADADGLLTIRYGLYLLSSQLDSLVDLGISTPFGDPSLWIQGVKLYVDGTLGGWTAYFPEGYVGDPCRTGQLYHQPEEYAELVARAHAAGLQTATHAQSPTAIGIVLDAVARARALVPDGPAAHRIEHCGLPSLEDIDRMADLGVLPVNQTQHYYNWGEGVTAAIGTPGERFNPLGEFERAGVQVTLSSDAPVADPLPLEAIQVAITRVTRSGHQLGDERLCISAAAALRGHTLAGAIALGRGDDLGSITPGKRADLAVLTDDPLAVPADKISTIEVDHVWVGGRPLET